MKKQLTILLILTFILGLVPFNFSEAITQNQISAEVQIVCPDNYGNWYSGSGTIIDPKGIILTNKHVVSDQYGGIIKTCFIGFTESISQEPNFGTETNPNLAEVKYYTTANDMDAAILYLNNLTNKSYAYVDIWNSNSNALQFGHKIEAIGFPGIGGSTITYTSGDFSGFGSTSDGTQNYLKATTPLEHGNSGGAAYNPTGQFIGIPTMVVAGTLNSLSYILSVNSIKSWLSGILGNNYQQEVIEQKPIVEKPKVSVQNDITPPDISKYKPIATWNTFIYYDLYNKNNETIKMGQSIDNKIIQTGISNKISLYTSYSGDKTWNKTMGYDVVESESGLYSVYYKFSNSLSGLNDKPYEEQVLKLDLGRTAITPIIELPDKEGSYYFSIKFKDNAGNVSNEYILTYTYLKEHYKELKTLYFYSDKNYKNLIGSYDMNFLFDGFDYLRCITKYNTVYVRWKYDDDDQFPGYVARIFPDDMYALNPSDTINNKNLSLITNNKIPVYNINKSTKDDHVSDLKICMDKNDTLCNLSGQVTSLLLKPVANKDLFLEGKNTVVKFHYNSNFDQGFMCGYPDIENESKRNAIGEPNYYILTQGNTNASNDLSEKLSGRILLQVEAHGEAYYVYPKDGKRYYMANGNEAYRIMRYLGVGITNNDLNKIKNDKNFAKKHSGKIFLQVESRGEAYYIDFNGNAHYLKDGAAAYTAMRELGLGITNNNLNKIPEGRL
ncbi:MAG: serine protease [Patescibacteria group bacterium]|nr:serine protease [Patescibacteria group bacterium]